MKDTNVHVYNYRPYYQYILVFTIQYLNFTWCFASDNVALKQDKQFVIIQWRILAIKVPSVFSIHDGGFLNLIVTQ